MDKRFISLNEFATLLGVGKTKFNQLFRDGHLPAPICIFSRRKVWKREVVDKYIDEL